MELFRKILAHPNRTLIIASPFGGYKVVVNNNEDVNSPEHVIGLKGITETLHAMFWPNYVTPAINTYSCARKSKYKRLAAHGKSSSHRNTPRRVNNQRMGQEIGRRVHGELNTYISIMQFHEHGIISDENAGVRMKAFAAAIGKNGIGGAVHPCTYAIIEKMLKCWKLIPLAAEWCAGDLHGEFKHATQIDLIVIRHGDFENSTRGKLILCEVKTGYNHGKFRTGNDLMRHVQPAMKNSPLHQAMIQLVMGADMFCSTYNISLDTIDLAIIHCPSKPTHVYSSEFVAANDDSPRIEPSVEYIVPHVRDSIRRALFAQRLL